MIRAFFYLWRKIFMEKESFKVLVEQAAKKAFGNENEYLKLLGVMGRNTEYMIENQLMIYMRNPNMSKALPAESWKKCNRQIIENAKPFQMCKKYKDGHIEYGDVYEYAQTKILDPQVKNQEVSLNDKFNREAFLKILNSSPELDVNFNKKLNNYVREKFSNYINIIIQANAAKIKVKSSYEYFLKQSIAYVISNAYQLKNHYQMSNENIRKNLNVLYFYDFMKYIKHCLSVTINEAQNLAKIEPLQYNIIEDDLTSNKEKEGAKDELRLYNTSKNERIERDGRHNTKNDVGTNEFEGPGRLRNGGGVSNRDRGRSNGADVGNLSKRINVLSEHEVRLPINERESSLELHNNTHVSSRGTFRLSETSEPGSGEFLVTGTTQNDESMEYHGREQSRVSNDVFSSTRDFNSRSNRETINSSGNRGRSMGNRDDGDFSRQGKSRENVGEIRTTKDREQRRNTNAENSTITDRSRNVRLFTDNIMGLDNNVESKQQKDEREAEKASLSDYENPNTYTKILLCVDSYKRLYNSKLPKVVKRNFIEKIKQYADKAMNYPDWQNNQNVLHTLNQQIKIAAFKSLPPSLQKNIVSITNDIINLLTDKISLIEYQQKVQNAMFEPEDVVSVDNKDLKEIDTLSLQSEVKDTRIESKITPISNNVPNYRITEETIAEKLTPSDRLNNNLAAISMLKRLENCERELDINAQDVLAKYVGWGGLADVFDENKTGQWKAAREFLQNNLTKSEYQAAQESTLTAFYTPKFVIDAMYDTLSKMGFDTGNILDPSMGIGNFIGNIPKSMQKSKYYGVELDSISGRIAKQLYPEANIKVTGFESTKFSNNFFDVAISNVPFGNFGVADKKYDKHHFMIHDYFFAKSIDKVRTGGIIAFITSSGTLDKQDERVRKYINERADFLGAIRLPNNVFKGVAGTDVTSDIIFLQKRDNVIERDADWLHVTSNKTLIMKKLFVISTFMIILKWY